MMRRLFDIVVLFKEYILLVFFLIISLILLSLNENSQIRAIRSLTVASLGVLQETFGFMPNYFVLERERRLLRELNVNLSDEVSRLREAGLENSRLRHLLELKEHTPNRYLSCNVVGKTLHFLRNTVTIDRGTDDGVQVNMPVITDAGLVGKVVATSSRYAVCQTLLNKDFRASVKIQRSRVDGILACESGERLFLKNVAKTLDVQAGDLVITSEYSSVFPPGIPVGVVSKTSQAPGALFQGVEITPSVDFLTLEVAFVVTHLPDSTRVALEYRTPH
jgi:rod shape-determining protein MreC